MSCHTDELRQIPLFSLLDDDELAVLSQQVELRDFAANQRIYKAGEPSGPAYVMLSGAVEVTLIDEDGQELIFSQPRHGDFFGFASMLEGVAHQTTAIALEPSSCIEVDRNDITVLLQTKPMAGLDMLTVMSTEIHSAQRVIRGRAMRNPNELIDEQETFGERIADHVASFGGSWTFIIMFLTTMICYVILSVVLVAMHGKSWDPYPFILLNLFLSMLAAIQAPVIMMSQNRQDHKDRVRSELDFEVNRRAESEIQALSRKLHYLTDVVGDIHEHVHTPTPNPTPSPNDHIA
jgi:CRP/FNR family transcriptional regulator, cyclic AMP receptor protein